jgi:hypothetical protein
MNTRWLVTRLAAFLIVVVASVQLQAQDWKKPLETALEAQYPLAKTGMDRLRITKPGALLVINAEGISGDLATDATYGENKIIDGAVSQRGGLLASMQGKKTSRTFQKGEKVYAYDINVRDDAVNLIVISAETFNVAVKGSTQQTRYKALVSFKFDKAGLPSMSVESVKKAIDSIMQLETEAKAAASTPKTIKLGQTFADVEAALGKPTRVVDLGAKVTWVYADMKVIFVDGKVTDVQ